MTESLTERLRQRAEPDSREREDHQRRTREAVERYKAAVERRSSQNSDRYRRPEPEHQRGLEHPEHDQPALDDRGRALILGLVILVGFFAWLLMQSAKPEAISDYRSFMQDDRRYLVFPEGSEIRNCRTSNGDEVFCVMLPSGE